MTVQQLKDQNSILRALTNPKSFLHGNDADMRDAVADEIKTRGVLQLTGTTQLATTSGTDSSYVYVSEVGFFKYASSGVTDNNYTYAAQTSGCWVLQTFRDLIASGILQIGGPIVWNGGNEPSGITLRKTGTHPGVGFHIWNDRNDATTRTSQVTLAVGGNSNVRASFGVTLDPADNPTSFFQGTNLVFTNGWSDSMYFFNRYLNRNMLIMQGQSGGGITIDNSSADGAGVEGTLIYNTSLAKLRGYENGSWKNVIGISDVTTGRIIYVDPLCDTATNIRTGLSKYSMYHPYSTIQAAVNASSHNAGDIVYVRPGSYTENVSILYNSGHAVKFIFDNAIVDGGTGSTLNFGGNGASEFLVYLINSTIKNTGVTPVDDFNTGTNAPISASATFLSIYGNSKFTCGVESINSGCISDIVGEVQNLTIKSTNSIPVTGIYGTAVATFNNCKIVSTNYRASRGNYSFKNCEIYGATSIFTCHDNWDNGFTIDSCYAEATGTGGTGFEMGSAHGAVQNITIKNSQIKVKGGMFAWQLYTSTPFALNVSNCTLTTDAATLWTAGLSNVTGDAIRLTNNTTNKPFFTDTFRTNYKPRIFESNTTTIDISIYYGMYVGFGAAQPTSSLDAAGTTGYDQLRLRTHYTPTSSSDTNGNAGDTAVDDNYFYYKTSTGWKRTALSTF